MASQMYIAEREQDILSARNSVTETIDALTKEIANHDGIIPENRDHWQTLRINLDSLDLRIARLQAELKKVLD